MKTNCVKSAVSLLLALCLLIVLAPLPPAAAEDLSGKCAGDVTWTLTSDGTLTISGTGELRSGSPTVRAGQPDNYFNWPWNKSRDQIKAIVVKEGITSIGNEAFYECENATKLSLPSTLKTIEKKSFYGCDSLEEVTIPNGVTEIGEQGFCSCSSLNRVFLPAGIKTVGRVAFDYTILQDVYYGGTKAQWEKVSVYPSDIWLKRVNMHYSASALPAATKPDASKATDWHFLMAICKNTNGTVTANGKTYTVKNSLTDAEVKRLYNVIAVFEKAMADTGLVVPHIETVVIDAPITKLASGPVGDSDKDTDDIYPTAEGVFTLLKNKKIDLSKYDHVTAFGALTREAPHGYLGLTHWISTADGPSFAFVEGNNKGKSYTEMELKRLSDYDTASVMVHELLHTMESLSGSAFGLHAIRSTFGWGNTGTSGVQDFKMNMLILQNQITTGANGSGVPAGTWTLTRTNALKAETLKIPEGAASITANLYYNLPNLKSVSLPSTVTAIEYNAFEGCKNLKTVYIPAGVTKIEYGAFSGTGVTDVYYGGTEAQWKKITFSKASDGKDYNDLLKNAKIHYSASGLPS